MAQGLSRLMEEDPTFVLERNAETHQTLLGGQGDIQLGIIQVQVSTVMYTSDSAHRKKTDSSSAKSSSAVRYQRTTYLL